MSASNDPERICMAPNYLEGGIVTLLESIPKPSPARPIHQRGPAFERVLLFWPNRSYFRLWPFALLAKCLFWENPDLEAARQGARLPQTTPLAPRDNSDSAA